MKYTQFALRCFFVIFLSLSLTVQDSVAEEDHPLLSKINLPPGFKISIFAGGLTQPRSLAVDVSSQTIFVGSRHTSIYSLRDLNQDGVADEILVRATGLQVPNGVAILDSILYIGENPAISRWSVQTELSKKPPLWPFMKPIKYDLPRKLHHGWRYIKFGPDQKLYVSIGSPCNICIPQGMEGTILRMNADGTQVETVARGIRNSVGFDWHPKSGELFFTDNGADRMGDDIPADELNRVSTIGQHFGFPYFGGKNVRLTGFENRTPPEEVVAPVVEFQAHTATLGMHFYHGDMFPKEYQHDAFVAQHGSWDRSIPVGYRIMRIRFNEKGRVLGKEVFANGWLQGRAFSGRPVDIAELPDGSLLVSDDYANLIYRITYQP